MKFSKCRTSMASRKHLTVKKSQTFIDSYFNIVGSKKKKNSKSIHRGSTSKPILVLDLDETLVHCSDTFTYGVEYTVKLGNIMIYVKQRPYLVEFLQEARSCCELVLFTASEQCYADKIISLFDDPKESFFSKRFYRDSCTVIQDKYFKDLTKITTNIRNILIIDDSEVSFSLQPRNGIKISSYRSGDDSCLRDLLPLIKLLPNLKDVRDAQKLYENRFANPLPVASSAYISSDESAASSSSSDDDDCTPRGD